MRRGLLLDPGHYEKQLVAGVSRCGECLEVQLNRARARPRQTAKPFLNERNERRVLLFAGRERVADKHDGGDEVEILEWVRTARRRIDEMAPLVYSRKLIRLLDVAAKDMSGAAKRKDSAALQPDLEAIQAATRDESATVSRINRDCVER